MEASLTLVFTAIGAEGADDTAAMESVALVFPAFGEGAARPAVGSSRSCFLELDTPG